MSKRTLWALTLMAISTIVLLLNRGGMDLNLLAFSVHAMKAVILFVFMCVGIVIGLLLK